MGLLIRKGKSTLRGLATLNTQGKLSNIALQVGRTPGSRTGRGSSGSGLTPTIDPPNLATLQFWYDFTDRSTLYTDTARTTQVTAAGQTINGITDKGVAVHHADSTGEVGPVYTKSGGNGAPARKAFLTVNCWTWIPSIRTRRAGISVART